MSPWPKLLSHIEHAMSDVGWSSVGTLRKSSKKKTAAEEGAKFWPDEVEAGTADVELEAVAHGQAVRVLCLGPGADEGACFVRIGWGDLSVEPEIWAVLGGVAMEVTLEDKPWVVPPFQVAGGPNQLQLGVGLWVGDRDYWSAEAVVDRAFEAFDALCAGLAARGQAGWGALVPGFDPFFAAAGAGLAKRSRAALPVGVGLVSLSVVGTVAAFIVDVGVGSIVAFNFAPYVLAGGVAALVAHKRRDKSPPGSDAFDRSIRSRKVFDDHERVRVLAPYRPVVVYTSSERPYELRTLGTATFRAGVFEARSTRHGLSLSASLQSLASEGLVHPVCRVVPSSWVVAELEGPDAILERLQTRRCQQRQPGVLRVVFDEAAFERGAFEELLAELAEVADSGLGESGPYR
jgi:hypothetical protein